MRATRWCVALRCEIKDTRFLACAPKKWSRTRKRVCVLRARLAVSPQSPEPLPRNHQSQYRHNRSRRADASAEQRQRARHFRLSGEIG